ncbi:tyrosine-type recombinase/integrase [Limosilactobacillus reuteri]|uniref:Tyrosine-type recombinase/integrase n=1 Tax=Limosilactobacillus reuteri TaxID=1598 RepID=A0AAW6JIU8_LIMRT|nr:tyrosine-type recombinase/integrase [Limosilactobacillus reuteri]MCC4517366.1 site-specific integrase [Limosilactobacillus reuteri]MDD1382522.1 tyrosine-type recombinase/integrase [Limosilactobacillus reuteri]MDD1399880.1 tyrosine-type recombinase/integrase [Limosilactobacillus reuteri]MDD1403960.1 tyrosine-type recombinase/integrase [Limosilactobacillus reuteri]
MHDFRREQQRFLSEKGIESNNDLIFLSLSDYRLAQLGKPISQRTMNDAMKELCKKANAKSNGLPLTCYTLRTTVGTRLARLGDYSYASNRLGNSLAVYMRYYVKPFNRGYGELMDQYLNM